MLRPMSLGLRLEGRRASGEDPAAFLERVAAWLRARDDDPRPRISIQEDGGHLLLAAELHPGAEPLLIEATAEGVVLSANTGTAGPGYHRHVCGLARELTPELALEWALEEDETGFFATGDGEALEQQALDWMSAVAEQVSELAKEGMRGLALFMPVGHAYEHDGFAATVLGPRDEGWFAAVREDPRRAIDIFPWWGEGRDGRYFLELARVHMWLDVRWRAPLDDAERARRVRGASWIERAPALDPALPIPWDEQAEILALLGEDSLRATRAQLKVQSLAPGVRQAIGYRRRPVRVSLSGGWSMRIPGELAEKWEERGTWLAWDARRSLWFNSVTMQAEPGAPLPTTEETLAELPPLSGEEPLAFERGALRAVACFVVEEHEGSPLHRLEAHAAEGPHAAIGTVVLQDEDDREWALETWASLAR